MVLALPPIVPDKLTLSPKQIVSSIPALIVAAALIVSIKVSSSAGQAGVETMIFPIIPIPACGSHW